mgnify:CR=1 FL=1
MFRIYNDGIYSVSFILKCLKYGNMIVSRAGKSAMRFKVKDYSIEPEHLIIRCKYW